VTVLDLDEAKQHLNISDTKHDAELVGIIAAAEAAIANRVGPLEPTDVFARVAGGTMLVLPTMPVVSITTVTPYGGAVLDPSTYFLDPVAGTLASAYGQRYASYYPLPYYDIVYVAGRAECPDDLLLAVKELVRHLWGTQRGGSQRPGSQQSDAMSNTLPGAAYAFPFRVEQLLASHEMPVIG
jgi:hypothetical protein